VKFNKLDFIGGKFKDDGFSLNLVGPNSIPLIFTMLRLRGESFDSQ
jgi:hypothetical protein